MNLKELYLNAPDSILLAHFMQWFYPGSVHSQNTGVSYDSSNVVTIGRQITLMKSLGFDGVLVDWYGPDSVNPTGDRAFQRLLEACEVLNFQAGICIDKGALSSLVTANVGMTYQQAFQLAYNYVKSVYAANPAFFRDFIAEFDCGAKALSVGQTIDFTRFPDVIHDDSKYGRFFTWAGLPGGQPSVTANYSNSNCVMGSLCFAFNDESSTNPVQSVWGGPARIMNRARTAANFLAGIKALPPTLRYVQLVTWNDYEEGTALEGVVAALNGVKL